MGKRELGWILPKPEILMSIWILPQTQPILFIKIKIKIKDWISGDIKEFNYVFMYRDSVFGSHLYDSPISKRI